MSTQYAKMHEFTELIEMNVLGPYLWISHDWEYRYASVFSQIPSKKGKVIDRTTSQYVVWQPFSSCSMTHLLRIELIRLVLLACGMLSHSSSMAGRRYWILVGTGTRCHTHWSIASQTSSMCDMLGEYAGHGRTGTFSASRNSVQILTTWGCALSCWNMRWWHGWKNNKSGLPAWTQPCSHLVTLTN